MNFITSFLSLLLVLLWGTSNNDKVRLAKQPTKEDYLKRFDSWMQRYGSIIIFIVIICCFLAFIMVCVVFVGLSATESGLYYNHHGGVI